MNPQYPELPKEVLRVIGLFEDATDEELIERISEWSPDTRLLFGQLALLTEEGRASLIEIFPASVADLIERAHKGSVVAISVLAFLFMSDKTAEAILELLYEPDCLH